MPPSLNRRKIAFITMAMVMLFAPLPSAFADTAIIRFDHARESDLVPAAKLLLSPSGRIAIDRRTHSLVVVDRAEVIEEIRALVNRLDQPMPEILVRVRFESEASVRERRMSVSGRVSSNGVGVGNRRRDGVDLRGQSRNRHEEVKGEQRVRVTSGSSAYIATGVTVARSERWTHWCRRYRMCSGGANTSELHTGFWVTPRVRGQQVVLRLSPQITGAASPRRRGVETTQIDTELTLPLGRWVDIGGMVRTSNEVSAAILQTGADRGTRTLTMMVRVDPAPR